MTPSSPLTRLYATFHHTPLFSRIWIVSSEDLLFRPTLLGPLINPLDYIVGSTDFQFYSPCDVGI